MSKFVKVMVALLAIAVFAAPAMAEDRLGLSGQMRVLFNYTDAGGENTNSYFSQRLRVGGKFSIADGVSVTFRTDWTESNWGSGNTFGSGRMANDPNGNLQWDRAHIDLDFDAFSLRAGQQYVEFGKGATLNGQSNGFKATIKGAVPVTLFFMLTDDNGSTTTNSDDYFYGGNVGHKTDMYAANVFFGGQKGDTGTGDANEEDVYMIGVDTVFNLEALKLTAEIDYFTGDADDNVDAMGLQGFVDAAFAASEMITVGGQVYYAQGADDGEVQYQVLGNDFGDWDPLNAIGVGLDNIKEVLGRPYNIFKNQYAAANAVSANAGVLGLRVYTTVKLNDATTLGASAAYLEPEDDDKTTADSAMFLAAGVAYKLMANTDLRAQVAYEDVDAPGAEEVFKVHSGLFVNF